MNPRGRARVKAAVQLALVAITVFYLLGPPTWLLISSFTPERYLRAVPPHWIPPEVTTDHYRTIFQLPGYNQSALDRQPEFKMFVRSAINSTILATATTVLCVVLGAPAAYSISRFLKRRHRKYVMLGLLATRMLPLIAVLIPIYVFFLLFGLLDSLFGLVIAYTGLLLPFVIWILEGFYRSFPIELEEAGRIDGATPFGVFRYIVLPLSANGIFAAAAFIFISTWSDFIVALLMTSTIKAFPISVVIAMGIDVAHDPSWGMINAAGLVAALIPASIAFAFRGIVTRGLFAGSVKG